MSMNPTLAFRLALVASTLALVACPAPNTPDTGSGGSGGSTPSVKKTPKASSSPKASATPAGGKGSPSPSPTPTGAGTSTPAPNGTATPTPAGSAGPSATPTPAGSGTPTPTPTPTATGTPAVGAAPTAAPNLPAGALVVETFAGSTATVAASFQKAAVPLASATFNQPRGLALGPDGAIYVADSGSHAIRKIKDGMVSTVVGTGITTTQNDVLTLNTPSDVAVDTDGTLYIADTLNHRIRKLRPGATELDFLCGNGGAGFLNGTGDGAQVNNPVGLALDGKGGLWISDSANHAIRKVVTATGALSTLAGKKEEPDLVNGAGAVARFMDPARCFAVGDDLFVADANNDAVRKVLADGTTSTAAAAVGIRGASSVVAHKDNSLLVLGAGTLAILKFTGPAVSTTVLGANGSGFKDGAIATAQFGSLDDLLVLPTGEILIADGVNHKIRKIKAGS